MGRLLPGQGADGIARVGERLGARITWSRHTSPQPGLTRLTGVRLAEEESGRTLAEIPTLEIFHREQRLTLVADRIDVKSGDLDYLWQALERMLRLPGAEPIRFAADEVVVQDFDGPLTLTQVDLSLDASAAASQASLLFRLPNDSSSGPLGLQVVRSRETTPASLHWRLVTGEARLPCRLASLMSPSIARCGRGSTFSGSMWARRTPVGWEGSLAGKLEQVDLSTLLEPPFPYAATGAARIEIEQAQFQNGHLLSATARVDVGPGAIQSQLLLAAASELGFVPARAMATDTVVPFHELALVCQITSAGLIVRGACDGAISGNVVVDTHGPLLVEPSQSVLPLAGLVRMLTPTNSHTLPTTAETEYLTRLLPLPTGVSQK
jgi:hypothetical protein